MSLFDIAICTIFARESLEGSVIVGQFRTAILRGYEAIEDGPTQEQLLRAVYVWAAIATIVAVIVVMIVAIPLAVLSNELDERYVMIIEGVSKIVAAVCILLLTLKVPKWFGFYKSKKSNGKVGENFDITLPSIRFNIAWNVWREVAECGVFLLPALLQGDNLKAIPLSAFSGILIGLVLGIAIYVGNQRLQNKFYLALFMTLLLVFLSTGLFVGGAHEFEEVWGKDEKVWVIEGDFWSSKKLPMAAVKPFGYSSSRTVVQIASFWSWLALAAILHAFMMWRTKKIEQELAASSALEEGEKDLALDAACEKDSPVTSEADEEAPKDEDKQ
jgi:high-affinity iron transporter